MRKSRLLAGLLALALVLGLVPGSVFGASLAQVPFWDVIGGRYETPVTALHQIGVVGGTSATTFSPSDSVTRAQMAALLVRALRQGNSATQDLTPKFTDVPASYWAFREVMQAEQLGIVRGVTVTEFQPSAPVTYPQATVMALRALGYDDGKLSYPTGYVLKAQELGLIEGLRWDLNGTMSRGEIAVLLANAVFKVKHNWFDKTLSQQYFRLATSVEIRPSAETIVTGATQLQAIGKDAYDGELTDLGAKWRIVSGNGTVAADGTLKAVSGKIAVEATVGELKVTRAYQVVSQLTITPDTATIKPGEKLQLKAVDPERSNEAISGATWAVVSGPATITQDGQLTASSAGAITVKASLGTINKTVVVQALSGLIVEPAEALATVGSTVSFSVKQPDGTPYTGPVEWSLDGAGVITKDGKFTATTGSSPKVKVKAGSLTGSATVQIINRLQVSPSGSVSMRQGQSLKFSAKAVTTEGKELEVPVTWSSTGRVGIVGGDGMFVGTAAGTGQVSASYSGIREMVNISVSGDPYMVSLSASRISVPANGRSPVTFTATLKDANGIVVNTETPIQFLLSDSTKGTLSAATVKTQAGVATVTFTPSSTAGSFRVTAAATDLTVLAGIVDMSSYAAVPAKIQLSAYPNPVASAANSRSTITATLVDNEGYEIANNTGTSQVVTLSFTNTTAASLSSAQITILPNQSKGDVYFHAGNPGDLTIYGAANYPVQNVTVKTLVAGAAAKVNIRPGIAETRADGATDMVVYVEVQDANGVIRTQDHGVAVTLTGVSEDGLTPLPTQVQTTMSGVATFRIRNTKAGKYTLTASSGALGSGTAQTTFVPSAAVGLRLSTSPTSDIAADGVSTIRLRAEVVDASGNRVPTTNGNVTFSRTTNNNAATLPSVTTVPTVNGVAEITLTATVYPTNDIFKAVLAGLNESNPVTVTSRITGVPSKLVAQVTGSAAVLVGSKITVNVFVQDSLGQTVTSVNNRAVRLVPNSPTAQVTGSGMAEGGVATFTVTDTKAGVVSLSITSDGLTSDTSKSVQFNAGAVAQINLKLSSEEMTADGGQSFVQLTAEAQDAHGNPVTSAVPISLNLSRNDVVSLSSYQLYTGNFVLVRAMALPGTAVISGSATIPVTPVTVSTFVPSAPAKVKVDPVVTGTAGTQMSFRVRIVDAAGHAITNLNTGSTLSSAGVILSGSAGNTMVVQNTNLYGLANFQANGVTHGSSSISSGVATFTYRNNKAENITVTPVVYYNGVLLPVETGLITTTPGNAVSMTVTGARTGLSSIQAETTLVEAVLTDAHGNVVTASVADTFTFTFDTSAYLQTNDQMAINTTNGKATIQVSSKVHASGGETVVRVTSTKTGFAGSVRIVTDRPPAAPILFVTDHAGVDTTLQPGEPAARLVVTVEARNANQDVLAYVNGIQVSLYASSGGGALANTILPGQTTLVAHILRSDLGGPGVKTIRIVIQNKVASSPMSNSQTITVQ